METEATIGLPPQLQHYTKEKNAFSVKVTHYLNAAAFAGLPLMTDTTMLGRVSTFLIRWRGALSIKLIQRAITAMCTFFINYGYFFSQVIAFREKFHGAERAMQQRGAKGDNSTRPVPPPSHLCSWPTSPTASCRF